MSARESNLNILLKSLTPRLNPGEYVYCAVNDVSIFPPDDVLMHFRENEGVTVIIKKSVADASSLPYSFVASWITLDVHSSLEAVGLTAAFSKALTDKNISCNVVAGYHHDHIFVDVKDADSAMKTLHELS